MSTVAVIDGQGGGIGKHIIKKLCQILPGGVEILALGTNAIATEAMMKAGANRGASGENAIIVNVSKVDYIVGTVGIITANAMLGELTPKMAEAIATSPAEKILLPLNMENIGVVGVSKEPLPHLIDKLVAQIIKKA